jgi:4-amino-4-deoxy-L-arabinose transferase-like glycosyltransferase
MRSEAITLKLHPVAPRPRRARPRAGAVIYWIAAAAVAAAFFAACFHGIANYWQWGHNGYNGAAFSQAARNSIRFHVAGQAQYHTALRPPRPSDMYTHHPMMLHAHLVAIYSLLGFHEWAGRLVPALYSFFTLLLLYFMVRRLEDPLTALAAAAIYLITPINLIFANMINHEQGGIFWCLFFLTMYLLWYESYRWRYLLLSLLGVTMAVQFDWPGYYISFFIAVHALVSGLVRHRGWLRWRPEYTWVTVFSAVVVLNFMLFFLWITLFQGTLDQMWEAFHYRTEEIPGYYSALYHRTRDLQGWISMALLVGWLLFFLERQIAGRVTIIHTVPLFFLLAQVIHTVVFKQAGIIHSYWTYYASPAIAVGGATLVVGLGRWTGAALRRVVLASGLRFRRPWTMRALHVLLVVLLVGPIFAIQGRCAAKRLRWGFATGAAAYNPDYDDQFGEIMWARELAALYDRRSTKYLLDRSLQWRIEFTYYIDAPLTPTVTMGFGPGRIHSDVVHVLLVDLKHVYSRAGLARLVKKYKTTVWDRRFVAVENVRDEGPIQAFVSEAQPAPLWWRWLVNPSRPPIRWVPDPDPEAAAAMFSGEIEVTAELKKGGYGGGPEEWDCPGGQTMSGLITQMFTSPKAGPLVSGLRPLCRKVVIPARGKGMAGKKKKKSDGIVMDHSGPWIGRWSGQSETMIACGENELPVGMVVYLQKNVWIKGLGLMCATVKLNQAGEGGKLKAAFYRRRMSPLAGLKGETVQEIPCPKGSVVWGFRGRGGDLIDAAGVSCVDLDMAFIKSKLAVVGQTPWK